jgi:hypothetical protein
MYPIFYHFLEAIYQLDPNPPTLSELAASLSAKRYFKEIP